MRAEHADPSRRGQGATRPGLLPQARPKQALHRCACGGLTGPGGECASCRAKRLARQRAAHAMPVAAGLTVSAPGDRYEREADRVADEAMRARPGTAARAGAPPGGPAGPRTAGPRAAGPRTAGPRTAAPEGGHPLPRAERDFFEPRLGHDLGGVRVHTGAPAAASARALSARAYTTGDDVVFGTGEYAPGTAPGRRLIAHELAHVVQQRERPALRSTVQRSITLTDPAGTIPHAPAAMGPFPTKENELNRWLDTLCPDGRWDVDPATGVVDSPDRATFCSARPAVWDIHHSTSRHPTSCGCLCDLTAPGSKTVAIQIDENLTVGGTVTPLVPAGEAATQHVSATDKVSAFTGREHVGVIGAGATTPHAGAGRAQTIPDPPWVIFGHEVCGHARLQAGGMGPTQAGHAGTPEGDVTTVDVENRIRREHSTVADSLGIRGGTFSARDAAGTFVHHSGSVYKAKAGDTMIGIAVLCGLSVVDMLDHMWRFNGDRITLATRNTLAVDERLLIEGIDWHEVIKGETMTSIAAIWAIPLASLQRANLMDTPPSSFIRPGDRLLIPAT